MMKRQLIDDDVLYAKFADNSLLYHSRPELLGVPYRFFMGILVDASLNAALPDGTSARSLAKELALYLLDTARLIPTVAPGLPTDGYLFQFGNQGAEYQRAQMPDVDARYARLGLAPILSPDLGALPGEFLLNLNDPPGDLNDPWLLRSDVLAASYFNLTTIPARELPPISAWDATGVVYPVQPSGPVDQQVAYSLAHPALITSDDFTGEMADQIQQYVRSEFEAVARRVAIHVFRLSPSEGLVSWLLDRGQWHMMKPPQPEALDTLRRQSKIRIQFWRELRRDLETLGE
jgi:hypothetical protein